MPTFSDQRVPEEVCDRLTRGWLELSCARLLSPTDECAADDGAKEGSYANIRTWTGNEEPECRGKPPSIVTN